MKKSKTPVSMGFGKDHPFSDTAAIPRAFRFHFKPENGDSIYYLCKDVTIDYKNKTIKTHLYEAADGRTTDWVQKSIKSRSFGATITLLDGCGGILFTLTMTGIKIVEHDMKLDYASNDVLTQFLIMKYNRVTKQPGSSK